MRTRYDSVAMSLHWIIAALVIFMMFVGEELMGEDEGAFLPSLHVSIGSAILLLTVLRLAWRILNPPPALPASMAGLEQFAAKAAHLAFYALLAARTTSSTVLMCCAGCSRFEPIVVSRKSG